MLVTANIFQPLIDVFEAVIKFFHNSVGIPWGWAIVLLTIVVRAAMIPLTMKQIKSMVRLQALSPQMKEVQAKYKEDKQRQQQEIMKLYKENGVNPFGSCLPLVAQLPVFVSLYYMLRQSLRVDICPGVQHAFQAHYAAVHNVSLQVASGHTVVCGDHNASFLFIHDLTDKATGVTLVVLLIMYVGTQLGSTIMMSASQTDAPSSAKRFATPSKPRSGRACCATMAIASASFPMRSCAFDAGARGPCGRIGTRSSGATTSFTVISSPTNIVGSFAPNSLSRFSAIRCSRRSHTTNTCNASRCAKTRPSGPRRTGR